MLRIVVHPAARDHGWPITEHAIPLRRRGGWFSAPYKAVVTDFPVGVRLAVYTGRAFFYFERDALMADFVLTAHT